MHRICFICVLLLPVLAASAQFTAKATVDSTHMLIGDQVRLHLDVVHPEGATVQPIEIPSAKETMVEFLGQTKWDTLQGGNNIRLRKDLILTAWDSGYHQIPSLPVVFQLNGGTDTIRTRAIPMEIMVPETDSTLADIKPIIGEEKIWKDYLPHIGTILAVILVSLLWYFASRKGRKETAPPPPVVVPAHEVALQQLLTLKEEKLWQQGQIKEYHSRLTHIIREYLENRYGIQALEQTTDEILQQLKNVGFSVELTEKMTALLQTADLVKFAKAEPAADFHNRALIMAEEFIHETKITEVPTEEITTPDVK